jgi:hypothetical protein
VNVVSGFRTMKLCIDHDQVIKQLHAFLAASEIVWLVNTIDL